MDDAFAFAEASAYAQSLPICTELATLARLIVMCMQVLPHGGVEGLVVLGALHTGAGPWGFMSTGTWPPSSVLVLVAGQRPTQ